MTQRIKHSWRMLLGIWFLLVSAVGFSGCEEPSAGVIVAPDNPPPVVPVEKKTAPAEKIANTSAVQVSKQAEPNSAEAAPPKQ